MASFNVCYNWMMDSEDPAREYEIVPDCGGYAISGINSALGHSRQPPTNQNRPARTERKDGRERRLGPRVFYARPDRGIRRRGHRPLSR